MGMGVASVPLMCVTWELEHGWLKEVHIKQLSIPRHLYHYYAARGAAAAYGGGVHAVAEENLIGPCGMIRITRADSHPPVFL